MSLRICYVHIYIGADYLKYDDCYNNGLPYEPRYRTMRDALFATGRPILYSMCTARYGLYQPLWSRELANSWRTTTDVADNWNSIMGNLDGNNRWAEFAGPGGWNDADMIQVGNGALTYDESVSHFSLWCLIKSPLLLSNDIRNMTAETLSILTNTEVIALNQDPLGHQGRLIYNVSNLQIWSATLNDGSRGVILFNRQNSGQANITVYWTEIGFPAMTNATVRDLWQHADLGYYQESFSAVIRSHASVTLKIKAVPPLKPCCQEEEQVMTISEFAVKYRSEYY